MSTWTKVKVKTKRVWAWMCAGMVGAFLVLAIKYVYDTQFVTPLPPSPSQTTPAVVINTGREGTAQETPSASPIETRVEKLETTVEEIKQTTNEGFSVVIQKLDTMPSTSTPVPTMVERFADSPAGRADERYRQWVKSFNSQQ